MGAPGSPTTRRRMPRPEGESRPRFTDRLPEDFTRPDINPFLVDVLERAETCRRNLYQEALQKGFLVSNAKGGPYLVQNTSFSAAIIRPGEKKYLWCSSISASCLSAVSCSIVSSEPTLSSKCS